MTSRRSPRCSALRTCPMSVTIPVNMACRLVAAHALVNFEPVDTEPPLVDEAPTVVGVGDRVEADIAEARLSLAADARGAVDQDPVDQVFGEERRRRARSPLDQQVVDVMKSIHILRISEGLTPFNRVAASQQRAARRGLLES